SPTPPLPHPEIRNPKSEIRNLKPILAVLDPEPAFTPGALALLRWLAREYLCSLSDALPLVVPQRHQARLAAWIQLAPGWDGTLNGRTGPVTARVARAIHQALA